MKKIAFTLSLLACYSFSFAQTDDGKWVQGFPITDYIVKISDSVSLVQVSMMNNTLIKEKQLGLLKGVYNKTAADTATIGYGRCQLIKGSNYYFTIDHKKSGLLPQKGNLLYTVVDKPKVHIGHILPIAAHHIGMQTVENKSLYNRDSVFLKWTGTDEKTCINAMGADIRYTGDYFLKNNPAMNVRIPGGKYNGEMVLNTMAKCTNEDVENFLDYIIARPSIYAGREWKISELFATWLSNGSPTVVKQ